MAAVMAIIIDNFQLKYRKVCASWNLFGRSFFIFYMKLTYNGATKPTCSILRPQLTHLEGMCVDWTCQYHKLDFTNHTVHYSQQWQPFIVKLCIL